MDYNNLAEKTIYDFSSDSEIINRITGNIPKDFYIRKCHILNRLSDIKDFALLTDNAKLMELADKALKEEQGKYDKTVGDALKEGIIVD